MSSVFATWQPEYAGRGIATIPVSPQKKPLVRHPQKFGLRGSSVLKEKFGDATMLGFYSGYRNKLTVLDVDTTDETVLIDALDRHGHTPVVTRSGSGKYHAWYKHNGERRRIRPWMDAGLEIDLLGTGGLIIVPPSVAAKGQYQFIQGDLDDIDHLPAMQGLDAADYVGYEPPKVANAEYRAHMRNHSGRNRDLFLELARRAHDCTSYDQLFVQAQAINSEYGESMSVTEVADTAHKVWGWQLEGRNYVGQHIVMFRQSEALAIVTSNQDACALLLFLRASNGPNATFMVSNGLAETFGWTRKRLAAARSALIELGYLKYMRSASSYGAALYRWASPIAGERSTTQHKGI